MKLKEFNVENCSGTHSRTMAPAISIDAKVGVLRINRQAAELLGLKAGDEVKFLQDEEAAADWFIEKVKTGGFKVREVARANNSLILNSTPVAKSILESVAFKGRSGRCLMAGKATDYDKRKLFALLTSTLKNKN